MDAVSLMASDGQFNDQGEQLDDWLMGNDFGNGNQIADPSAVRISDDSPTTGLAQGQLTIDPINYLGQGDLGNGGLSNDNFPDLTDLSPRGVDDRSQGEKEKATSSSHAAVPPDLISLVKTTGDGIPSLSIDPLTNLSLTGASAASQGLGADPISNEELGIHPVANQSGLVAPGSQGLLVGNGTGHELGPPGSLNIATGNHSLHVQLQLGELATRQIPGIPGTHQGLFSANVAQRLSLKRDRDSAINTAQKQSADLAKQLVGAPILPPKQMKRRKTTRGAPSKAAASTVGGASSGIGGSSASGKGSSSKRQTTSRARHGNMNANLTAEERRKIRAERNRESAEKSRLRHKQRTLELEQNVLRLRTENRELKARVDTFRIQLQAASQNIETSGNGNFGGEGIVATQVPALHNAIAAIEQVMAECPRTFRPEPNVPEIALNVKATR